MPWCKPFTVSPVRVEANRRNAQKSTGRRTARVKLPSRLDALRDGGTGVKMTVCGVPKPVTRALGYRDPWFRSRAPRKKRILFFDVRSWNVYENKQNAGKMSCQMSDIYVELAWILREIAAMWGHFGPNYGILEPLWPEGTMHFSQLEHAGRGRRAPQANPEKTRRSGIRNDPMAG